MKKLSKLDLFLIIVFVILIIWIIASWIEVITHNIDDTAYNSTNFFVLLLKINRNICG